jgi:hypothetical protein
VSADGGLDVLELARLVVEAHAPDLSVRMGALVRLGAYVRMHNAVIIAAVEQFTTSAKDSTE